MFACPQAILLLRLFQDHISTIVGEKPLRVGDKKARDDTPHSNLIDRIFHGKIQLSLWL